MKLRMKGNSIRLRLTQGEVESFARDGRVADRVLFAPSRALSYTLARDPEAGAQKPRAEYRDDEVIVFVPGATADQWIGTELVGFRGEMPLAHAPGDAGAEVLRILVEKDFHCLVPRPDEDESDHYANPLAKAAAEPGAQQPAG